MTIMSTSFRRVLYCIQRKSIMGRLVLLLNLYMIKYVACWLPNRPPWSSPKVKIDKDHLTEYPYCGSMHYNFSEYASSSSKAVNAKDSTSRYRWLVVLEMENMRLTGVLERSTCTGSVITDR